MAALGPRKKLRLGRQAAVTTGVDDLPDDCLVLIFGFLDPCFSRHYFDISFPSSASAAPPTQHKAADDPLGHQHQLSDVSVRTHGMPGQGVDPGRPGAARVAPSRFEAGRADSSLSDGAPTFPRGSGSLPPRRSPRLQPDAPGSGPTASPVTSSSSAYRGFPLPSRRRLGEEDSTSSLEPARRNDSITVLPGGAAPAASRRVSVGRGLVGSGRSRQGGRRGERGVSPSSFAEQDSCVSGNRNPQAPLPPARPTVTSSVSSLQCKCHQCSDGRCPRPPDQDDEEEPLRARPQFQHALVCKRWRRLAPQAVRRLQVKELRRLPAMKLAAELARLPNVSHLSLAPCRFLPSMTPRFWASLPGALTGLRVLRLSSLGQGERGPGAALDAIFTHCLLLEELEVRNMLPVRCVPESLGRAQRLVRLSLRKRPASASGTAIITTLPESIGNLTRLQELDLRGCIFLSLPSSLANLPSVKIFRIQFEGLLGLRTTGAESCVDVINKMQSKNELESLQISTFTTQHVPASIFDSTSLVSLSIHCCPLLTSVPLSASCLVSLRHLRLIYCESLVTLPDSLGQLPQLASLDIAFCSSFTTIPDSVGSLAHLRSLTFLQCPALRELPDSMASLQSLEELRVFECTRMRELPPGLGSVTSLKKVFLFKCAFRSLPRTFLQLVRRGTTVYIVGEGARDMLASFRHCSFKVADDGTFAIVNVEEPQEDGRWLAAYFNSLEKFL